MPKPINSVIELATLLSKEQSLSVDWTLSQTSSSVNIYRYTFKIFVKVGCRKKFRRNVSTLSSSKKNIFIKRFFSKTAPWWWKEFQAQQQKTTLYRHQTVHSDDCNLACDMSCSDTLGFSLCEFWLALRTDSDLQDDTRELEFLG